MLARTLSRYLSEVNGAAIVAACAKACGMRRDQLGPQHVLQIVAQVEASFDFFGVTAERRIKCLEQLKALAFEPQGGRAEPTVVGVEREGDIVRARLAGKMMCQKLGFSDIDTAKIVTAISELSRNIVKYAARGTITLRGTGGGLEIIANDRGPGIPDVEAVLRPAHRSRTETGSGLRGARAVMDSFEIRSRPGEGTTVTLHKLKAP